MACGLKTGVHGIPLGPSRSAYNRKHGPLEHRQLRWKDGPWQQDTRWTPYDGGVVGKRAWKVPCHFLVVQKEKVILYDFI